MAGNSARACRPSSRSTARPCCAGIGGAGASARANVRFVSYPLGGNGGGGAKQILGLVSLIAVSAFAFWAGPLVAGALGAGAPGAAGSAIAGGLATGLIGLGGALLVNALIMPKPGATNAPDSTQDQIYSVLAQGNAAKLGQPLPVWYGRLKAFPEFAATPWAEFVGNDQWLNVLLSVSMGSMAYEALYVDDTVLWDPVNGISSTFTGAQVAFYEPGQTVTLFPVDVDASSEVNGQQLPDGAGSTTLPGQDPTPGPPLGHSSPIRRRRWRNRSRSISCFPRAVSASIPT